LTIIGVEAFVECFGLTTILMSRRTSVLTIRYTFPLGVKITYYEDQGGGADQFSIKLRF